MFVFSEWEKFCKFIAENEFNCIRTDEILLQDPDSNWIVIKHDVETDADKALQLAEIEARHGVRATYYVQSYLLETSAGIFVDIQNLGHEVSYHYDVLDANQGDYKRAIIEFTETVQKFIDCGLSVNTVCPHGNPIMIRNGWSSNKDFFKNNEVRSLFPNILDIVVDSKDKIPSGFVYISDAGYGWKKIGNIYDNDSVNVGDTDLHDMEGIKSELANVNRFIISCHPHRWESSAIKAGYNLYLFKLIRGVVKPLLTVGFIKRFLSKFYYLAKKI